MDGEKNTKKRDYPTISAAWKSFKLVCFVFVGGGGDPK
jgi:hypothetical protein